MHSVFGWWKRRRRQKLLASPFPAEWEPLLLRGYRHLGRLTADAQQRLRNDLRIFVAEKHWEGCNGLVVTDEMRVTIAAHAVSLGLGFPEMPFNRLVTVLIYPDTFVSRTERRLPSGVFEDANEPRLGEAWYQGPILLSWRDVRQQCIERPDGRNVVVHEFAHLLDMQDGSIDGMPILQGDRAAGQRWVEVFHDEYRRLIRQIRRGRDTVLDIYGTTSEIEFFAVASEAFFELGTDLLQESPELYGILCEYYRQDTASESRAAV